MQSLVKVFFGLLFIIIAYPCYAVPEAPFEADEHTLALWHFDNQMPEFTEPVNLIDERFKGIASVIRCQDGGYAICGTVEYPRNHENPHDREGYVMKLNQRLEVLWVINAADEHATRFFDLAETENGNIMVIGVRIFFPDQNENLIFCEFDQDGELINQGNLAGIDEMDMFGNTCTILNSSNNGLILGYDSIFDGTIICKLSADMEEIWSFRREFDLNTIKKHGDDYMLIAREGHGMWWYYFIIELFDDNGEQINRSAPIGDNDAQNIINDGVATDHGYLFVGYKCNGGSIGPTIGNSQILNLSPELELLEEHYLWNRERRTWAQQITKLPGNKYMCTGSLDVEGHNSHEVLTLHFMDDSGNVIDSVHSRLEDDLYFDPKYPVKTLLNEDLSYTVFSSIESTVEVDEDSTLRITHPYIIRTTPHKIWNSDCSGNAIHIDREDGVYTAADGRWDEGLRSTMDEEIVGFIQGGNVLLQPEQFTIEAWIKLDQAEEFEGTILCQKMGEDQYSWLLNADNNQNRIDFYIGTDAGERNVYAEVENLNNGDWHYVAVNYDGENVHLFVDDAHVEWEHVGSPVVYGVGELIIGGRETSAGADGQFYGWIDEIRISDATREEHSVPGIDPHFHPKDLAITEVYPNPFNSTTTIAYNLSMTGEVRLSIHDIQGRLISVLQNGVQTAGYKKAVWNTGDQSSGLYLCKLESKCKVATAKLMLVK